MGRSRSQSDVVIEFSLSGRRRRLRCSPLRLGLAASLFGLTAAGFSGGAQSVAVDDFPARFVAREKHAQQAYESRIAALRRRVDDLVGGQRGGQTGVEGQVQSLARRQAQLETRAAAVADLVERALAEGVTAVARGSRAGPIVTARGDLAAGPSPPTPAAFDAKLELRLNSDAKPIPLPPDGVERRAAAPVDGPDGPLQQRLEKLAASIDRVALDQSRRLSDILRPALKEATRLRRVFDVAGISVGRPTAETRAARPERGGVGGPFVAAPEAENAPFERDLAQAQTAMTTLESLRRALPANPVRAPLAGPLQPTSSFGYRTDPFLGRPALHAGIDLRDAYGAPVRAAAGGVVAVAVSRGGYGNLVEINHGDGVSTRYGHLSEIDVVPGEAVKPGAVLGRVGSSGRSTGPHLHYEVRIDGEAVDPARFLEAAALLESTK